MKFSTSDLIAISFFLLAIHLVGTWTIDISISTLIAQQVHELTGSPIVTEMTNGFWVFDPMQMYHVGLYMTVFSIFSMGLLVIHGVMRE